MREGNVNPASPRSRRRRNVIGSSPNRDEYVRLMRAGWSSIALERYAAFRYGEDIPNQTFRAYRKRQKIERENPKFKVDVDEVVDVIGLRADMIRLQVDRIGIDYKHEQAMGKLFGTLRNEISLLDGLLDSHKRDLQDVGLMPKSPDELKVTAGPSAQSGAPKHLTLGQMLGIEATRQVEADVAKVLYLSAAPHVESDRDAG